MSPLHFAFMHQHEPHNHESKKPTFSVPEKECAYCDFHFFHFISGTVLYKDIAFVRHTFSKKADNLIRIWVDTAIHESILGRAPPFDYLSHKTQHNVSFNNQKR